MLSNPRIPTASSDCEEYTIRGQLVTEEDQNDEVSEH